MQLDENIRWKFRYEGDFKQKVFKLYDMIEEIQDKALNNALDDECRYKVYYHFVSTFEGGVRTLKDFMRYQGIFQVETREIIKEAFYVEIIEDGQSWIDMMFDINETNRRTLQGFDFQNLFTRYLKAFTDLVQYFEGRLENNV